MPTDELWIGLNDQRSQFLFEWSDRSHVTYTRWQVGEPSHATNHREDCVLIRGKVASKTHRSYMGSSSTLQRIVFYYILLQK